MPRILKMINVPVGSKINDVWIDIIHTKPRLDDSLDIWYLISEEIEDTVVQEG